LQKSQNFSSLEAPQLPLFSIYASRLDYKNFQNLSISQNLSWILFGASGIDISLSNFYETPILIPDEIKDLILVNYNFNPNLEE
jgi:hypothetical protein